MASPRRVGTETSNTRVVLLDSVERLMVDAGYASVTYRGVAAEAGVTAGLVQYYFPTLDDLLVATIRRRSEQGLQRFGDMLRTRPDQPLRVLWEFSADEVNAALTMEFMALGNHRKSIRSEITAYTNRLRELQLEALVSVQELGRLGDGDLSAAAVVFLLSGIPKLVRLEDGFDVFTGHDDAVELVQRYVESVEPTTGTAPTPTRGRSQRQPSSTTPYSTSKRRNPA